MGPSQKTLRPPGVPGWLRACGASTCTQLQLLMNCFTFASWFIPLLKTFKQAISF